ncbi:MAG: hypothetical protein VCG02_17990 [Verrucomicrobiota bacterium]
MRFSLLILLLSGTALQAASLPHWTANTRRTWWTRHAEPAEWQEQARKTHDMLATYHQQVGTQQAMQSAPFIQWLGHLFWLRAYPDDLHADLQPVYRQLSLEPKLPWIFLAALQPQDDTDRAMDILCRLYRKHPDLCRSYASMAVAMALVWDQALPDGWPHPFVDRDAIPIGDADPVHRFEFLVHSHRTKRFLHDPRGLGVHELVFMVDSPLAFSELLTCQKVSLRKPRNLSRLYRSVDYNYRRVSNNETIWTHEPYRIATILKHGGICADQAYLVSQTGKAHGVPTILFFGQGDHGAHAWVGYLEEKGEWHFNVARYSNEHYPVGQAYHPQTRKRISDYELAAFNHHNDRNPAFRKTRLMIDWARLNADEPFYAELVIMARRHLPHLIQTWTMEDDWHWKKGRSLDRHVAFLKRWIEFFEQVPAAKFEGQKRLLTLYTERKLTREAKKLEDRIIKETASERFDLGIHLAAESILEKAVNHQWKAAEEEFKTRMNDFRNRSGGHLFYGLLQPYIVTCIEERRYDQARKAMQLTRRFDGKGTVLGNDMKALGKWVSEIR